MKEFTQSMPFLIFFLISTLLLNMFAGSKMANAFLMLVLASMAVMNADKIKSLLGKVSFNE